MTKKPIYFFAYILCIYLIFLDGTIRHEQAHSEIFRHFGCENISLEINYFTLGGTATCTSLRYLTKDEILLEKELHLLNEIESYNNLGTKLIIFASVLFLSLFLSKETY